MDKLRVSPAPHATAQGFSLVEVAMAIGIVSFAFVALFALMPTGITTFREAIDTQSETWISDTLNSMVQTTEWEKIYQGGADGITSDVYYFDEEARITDTKNYPSLEDEVVQRRLYAVRLFVLPLERIMPSGSDESFTRDENTPVAVKVIGVLARLQDKKSMDQLEELSANRVSEDIERQSRLKVFSFVAAQLNADRRVTGSSSN